MLGREVGIALGLLLYSGVSGHRYDRTRPTGGVAVVMGPLAGGQL